MREEYMLPCMHKKLFGIECMGCGTQRSFFLLLEGEFVAAFKMFPAIYTTLLFFIVILLHFFDKKRNYSKMLLLTALINSIIMVIAYAYKMRFLY